jgi:hypothetical protein
MCAYARRFHGDSCVSGSCDVRQELKSVKEGCRVMKLLGPCLFPQVSVFTLTNSVHLHLCISAFLCLRVGSWIVPGDA